MSAGYEPVRNTADKRDGLWKLYGKRQTIYARSELTIRDRIAAATHRLYRLYRPETRN